MASPVFGERVTTLDGGSYQVDSYRVEGDWAHLELTGSGLLLLPLAKIDRVVDDTLVSADEGIRVPSETLDLGFDESAAKPETPFAELIFESARRHGINARLVAAMIEVESRFDPKAVSNKGARGLLQLMPATAERFGVSSERLFEPAANLEAGLRYLTYLGTRYPNDPARILAAYNAGESQVDRYKGVPPFRETRDYLRKISAALE